MTDPILSVGDLWAGYGATPILRGVDLEVGRAEIVAVLGANGVGKTTLNTVLSGVIAPSSGSIQFDGRSIGGLPPSAIVAMGLIHVPEGRKIFPNLTVRENLELGSYRRGRAARERTMSQVYGIFPRLAERRLQTAGTLSGGEQQMLAIGRGLMSEPKLLILDEPSLGLSPILVEEMFELIRRINAEGLALLLVEQNVMQSLEIAHRASVMENGRFVLSGAASDLARNPDLEKAYLGI